MNLAQIEDNLQQLVQSYNQDSFIYDLLLAYGQPKASITRLQKGGLNLSKIPGEIDWKKKLFFKEVNGEDPHDLIDNIAANEKAIKHDPRFLIVTDYKTLLAVDRKTGDTLDIPLLEIAKHFDFFLPWAGMEKKQVIGENPADVKAAEKMAKLYDEIKKDNPAATPEEIHNLNVFLSRLLFCFFAEDTEIFEKNLFTNSVANHTQQDGSDLNTYLDHLFEVMNTDNRRRSKNISAYLNAFPYVNGGLFRNPHKAPVFSRKSRHLLIECGSLQWKDIHPDIFGSMIQAVVTPEHRGGFGMHYTSVPNIMKVIEPLFLDELKEEFEAVKNEPRGLSRLLERLSRIKIFDPACGSGNFLIIAYKELRLLEIKILQRLQLLQKAASGFEPKQLELIPKAQLTLAAGYKPTLFSRIELSQFYGIELDDFAHEIAILSLWLAQHQMNMKFKEVFGSANPTLPLQAGGNIVQGNATRINWENVCPKNEGDEIYILGNPPYLGSKKQTKQQKAEMTLVFNGINDYKNLDYISCWFYIGSKYIEGNNAVLAFVSTNSITQGDQVGLLWPHIFSKGIEIGFARTSFKWANNAKDKAGVNVIIISLRNNSNKPKYLYGNYIQKVSGIGPYLIPNSYVIVKKRVTPLSTLPEMAVGNMSLDGGFLKLTPTEKDDLLRKNIPSKFIRPLTGGDEFLNSLDRYCIWIEDEDLDEANSYPELRNRIDGVKEFRKNGGDVARTLLERSHQFRYRRQANLSYILIPCTSSEKREYLQIGFLDSQYITLHSAQAIYDSDPWPFALISSKMHICWIKAVCGSLESRIRYSNVLGYNTFPFPEINKNQKQELERHVFNILSEREKHSEKTLAQLYDPEKMPQGLREAHKELDLAVERCYRSKPFESDEERLEYLFKLYEQMIAEEQQRSGELIFEQQKTKKKKTKA
ncbi:MAG TPA: DNA methyltransferase [Flavipsychrobacter sp.]|nr:DNA methyltransferase [Flavipsychrobacter sp.]